MTFMKTYCDATWENYKKISEIENVYMYTKFLDTKIFPKNSIFYILGGFPIDKYALWYCKDKSQFHNIKEFREIFNENPIELDYQSLLTDIEFIKLEIKLSDDTAKKEQLQKQLLELRQLS